jgi:hypothetical protein
MIPNFDTKSFVLKANQATVINVTGQYFACVSSAADFGMQVDAGNQVVIKQGYSFPTTHPFTRLTFIETSGSDNPIQIVTADKGFSYQPPALNTNAKNAPTYTKGSGLLFINFGVTVDFSGLDGVKLRKQFIVANGNPNFSLYIKDKAGAIMGICPPLQSWTCESGDKISVFNQDANPNQAYCVGEVYYA